ncbi:MAG: sulfate adenylyltransferase [Conexivisphaerales archaeon]
MIEPYGGRLVENFATEKEAERLLAQSSEIPRIRPAEDHIYDAEKIGIGAYSPLEGFMGPDDYSSVINKNRLSNGLAWTMPIVLLVDEMQAKLAEQNDELLIDDLNGQPFAVLHVEQVFRLDRVEMAEKVYSTKDPLHPNVADLYSMGEHAVAGKVKLLRRLSLSVTSLELSPRESRERFSNLGWKNVAAYQARNPPHLAHEYIQRITLERDDIDGLFIQPVVGKLKKGDYRPEVIMKAYQIFVEKYYPKDRVLLGSLSISMRYAGPKAVLFYAIVRRNYGCSHYRVGRDQAGVGSYYDPYAGHRIFDKYDVGVVPLKYNETFYCRICSTMVSSKVCPHPEDNHVSTSQTKIRKLISEGKPIPSEIIRPEVAEVLSAKDVILT